LILLDDASADGSYEELDQLLILHPHMTLVRNEQNLGQHPTIIRGLSVARGRLSVIMDCDLQDPPELIPVLVGRIESGGADAVIVRYSNYSNGLLRYLLSRGHAMWRRLRGVPNNDPRLAVYRVFGANMKQHLLRTYVKGRLLRDIFDPATWKIEYLDTRRKARFAGRSSYTVSRLLGLAGGRR
jgi:dolichol-phosphate mannosyltransferase